MAATLPGIAGVLPADIVLSGCGANDDLDGFTAPHAMPELVTAVHRDLRRALKHARRAVRNRENTRFARTRIYGVARAMFRAMGADLVFLQEVRLFHTQHARQFQRTSFGWPEQGQAEFLAPVGYEAAYRSNAVTRHGEPIARILLLLAATIGLPSWRRRLFTQLRLFSKTCGPMMAEPMDSATPWSSVSTEAANRRKSMAAARPSTAPLNIG